MRWTSERRTVWAGQVGRWASVCLLAGLVGGCSTSALKLTESLQIAMTGTLDQPSDATGNADPHAETFKVESVTVVTDKASTAALTGDPVTVRVIGRPQIVLEYDLKSLEGQNVQSVDVVLSTDVTADGKYATDLPLTLPTTVATIHCLPQSADDQPIQSGKGKRCDLDVQWHNTLTRDDAAEAETATPPSFVQIFTAD